MSKTPFTYFPARLYDICLRFVARYPRYNLQLLPANIFEDLCKIMMSGFIMKPIIPIRLVTTASAERELLTQFIKIDKLHAYVDRTEFYNFSEKYVSRIWMPSDPGDNCPEGGYLYRLLSYPYMRTIPDHLKYESRWYSNCPTILREDNFSEEQITEWKQAGLISPRRYAELFYPAKN